MDTTLKNNYTKYVNPTNEKLLSKIIFERKFLPRIFFVNGHNGSKNG